MRRLTDSEIIEVWEVARGLHPVDQALALLAAATPEHTPDELARLSIGQRDARLLALRQAMFGDRLDSVATCPRCSETLEFELSCSNLSVLPPEIPVYEITVGDYHVRLRPLDSHDLAAAATMTDAERLRWLLLSRCIVEARRGRKVMDKDSLPEAVASAVSTALLEADPQAEILLDLACPACGHAWQAGLDIARIAWSEITARARRLLTEVHVLARAYGWREGDVLALSPARRNAYIQMVAS